jgi:hypothetical protein
MAKQSTLYFLLIINLKTSISDIFFQKPISYIINYQRFEKSQAKKVFFIYVVKVDFLTKDKVIAAEKRHRASPNFD